MTPSYSIVGMLTSEPFWSAVGAVATLVASLAIFVASRQFRFDAWNKCQEAFVKDKFYDSRAILFRHLHGDVRTWSAFEMEAGRTVCGNMDELCRLTRFLGKRGMLKTWGNPIAKSWALLRWMVEIERRTTEFPDKWAAFEEVGNAALKRQPLELATRLRKISDALCRHPPVSSSLKPSDEEKKHFLGDLKYLVDQIQVLPSLIESKQLPLLRDYEINLVIQNALIESSLSFLRRLNEFFGGTGREISVRHYFPERKPVFLFEGKDHEVVNGWVMHLSLRRVREGTKDWEVFLTKYSSKTKSLYETFINELKADQPHLFY